MNDLAVIANLIAQAQTAEEEEQKKEEKLPLPKVV